MRVLLLAPVIILASLIPGTNERRKTIRKLSPSDFSGSLSIWVIRLLRARFFFSVDKKFRNLAGEGRRGRQRRPERTGIMLQGQLAASKSSASASTHIGPFVRILRREHSVDKHQRAPNA